MNAPGAPGPVTYTLIAAFQSGATPPASATIDVSANLTLILVSGNDQAAPPGQPLANPLVVRLVDSQGRPVTGVSVSWSGSNPRDALSATSVATDSSGLSSIAVTLGSDPGDRTFTATAFKSSVVFTVRDLNRVLMKPAQQLLVPMTRTAITATRTQLETVAQHLDDVRRTCSSSAGGGGGDATVNGQSLGKVPWDGFVAGEISVGRQATTGEQSGYKLTTKSITVGTDLSCGGNYIIGVAVGFFRSDSRQDDGSGDQDAKGASASLWGSFAPFTDAYVDVVANFGQGHYDSQRRTTLAELSAGTHGDQAAVAARAGYSFKSGRTQFDPYYSVEHIEARVDGFSESGGIDAIAVSDVKVKSTVQTFGGKLRHTFDTSWGEITPHARVEVSRQTQDSGDSVAVQLVASPGVTQAMTLPQQNHSYGIFALGASGIYDKRYEWYLNYERSFGNDFQVSAFTARLRLQF